MSKVFEVKRKKGSKTHLLTSGLNPI